ncbi:MAG: histidine phosphatase family protein [Acidobacteriota bacterium]|nr:histidine phosphatase family protein [Acidobacteriota bacterium]
MTVPAGVRTLPAEDPSATPRTRLVLVRHGEATCNVTGVVGGPRGCTGLSEHGRAQTAALRRRLAGSGELAGAAALYSRVLPRAVETAAAIAGTVGGGGLAVEQDCALCELHPGRADGLTWAQFTARFPEPDWGRHPATVLAPGGESWSGFVTRAADALVTLVRRHPGELVVAVCHAGVVEAAMLRCFGLDAGRRLRLPTVHSSLTELEVAPDGAEADGWRLRRYNDAAHLAG